jgi:hypothetical protein
MLVMFLLKAISTTAVQYRRFDHVPNILEGNIQFVESVLEKK